MTEADTGRTPPRQRPSRRRHPAAAGRVLATGLSVGTFLGAIAVLAADPAADAGTAPAPTTAPDTIVAVREVRQTVYVDEQGRPVPSPAATSAPPTPSGLVGPTVLPAPVVTAAPVTPAVRPAAPACTGSRCG